MQTDEQIRDMVRGEFYIGAVAQGLGETSHWLWLITW